MMKVKYSKNRNERIITPMHKTRTLQIQRRYLYSIRFNGDIYIQSDGVAMGSPLQSLLANVFMCSLEKSIVPTLEDCLVH